MYMYIVLQHSHYSTLIDLIKFHEKSTKNWEIHNAHVHAHAHSNHIHVTKSTCSWSVSLHRAILYRIAIPGVCTEVNRCRYMFMCMYGLYRPYMGCIAHTLYGLYRPYMGCIDHIWVVSPIYGFVSPTYGLYRPYMGCIAHIWVVSPIMGCIAHIHVWVVSPIYGLYRPYTCMGCIAHIWVVSPIYMYGLYRPYTCMGCITHIWVVSPIYGLYRPYMGCDETWAVPQFLDLVSVKKKLK